jgi:hypothetical protein
VSNEQKAKSVACPECGVEVTHLRRHLQKVHPGSQTKAPAAPRKRAARVDEKRSGELWARCPECRMPVKDADLFKHLLNCPGAEVRQSEWAAQQAAAAAQPQPQPQPPAPTEPQPDAATQPQPDAAVALAAAEAVPEPDVQS